jgi:hypothetical protein
VKAYLDFGKAFTLAFIEVELQSKEYQSEDVMSVINHVTSYLR